MAESPDVIAFPTLSDAQLARLVDYGEESPPWRPAGRFFGELSLLTGQRTFLRSRERRSRS